MASAFGDSLAPSPCEQCGNVSESTMRCFVRDSKNLCQGCFQDLPQARREDIGDPEWVCDIHSDSKVDIFCETCKRGCCNECAVDVHQDHKVVNVLKHVGEIRCDLTELLQEVGVRADGLSELRPNIESSLGKIEEDSKSLDKLVDKIKEGVAQNLEQLLQQIQWETQQNIIHQEKIRDNKLELAKEKADLKIQMIEELQRDISTGLLEDAERIQKAESKLLECQQACESSNLQIKSMLVSTLQELACHGRQLCSLVKTSLAFQCQDDVLDCCREDVPDCDREHEADPTKLEVKKEHSCYGSGPFLPLVKIVLHIFVVFYFAIEERGAYINGFNRLLSSESIESLIMLCAFFPLYHVFKCSILTVVLACSMYDYRITRKESFMKKLKSCMVQLGFEFWDQTFCFLIYVSFPLYFFQVKSVSANIVSIISILHSYSFSKEMRKSKTFKELLCISEA